VSQSFNEVQFWKGYDGGPSAQKTFMEWGPSPILFMGGVGSGKTWIGILKLLYLLDLYPGSRAAIVRQRATQIRSTTLKTLFQLHPVTRFATKNINAGEFTMENGSQIILRHLDKENSIEDLKSLELNFAYIDQMEDVSAIAFDTLCERIGRWSGAMRRGGYPPDWPHKNRLGQCIPPKYILASAYSPGYDHWITSRWWEQGDRREEFAAKGYKVVVGSTRDNLTLSQDYVDERVARGKEYVERYVDAVVWGANEGLIFDIPDSSILDPTPELLARILRTMRLHRTYDHGDSSPSACAWSATDSDGNIFYYREYQKENQLISEHRRAIYETSCLDTPNQRMPPMYYSNYADPKIFTKDRGRTAMSGPNHSVADEWLDRNIMDGETAIAWRRANNNESVTVNRVKEYLREDPNHRHPITKQKGAPHMYFVRRTSDHPTGIHEMLSQLRSAKRVVVGFNNEGEKLYGDKRDDKVVDHLTDVNRYFTGSRPALALKPAEADPEPGSIRWKDYQETMEAAEFEAGNRYRREYTGASDYGY